MAKRFHPPKVTDPPKLVEIEWIDAQSEIEFEGPAKKSGGLILLPTAGYHVRTGRHPHHGSFVVIAREWFRDEETNEVYSRDTTSIPTGWIRKWAEVGELRTVWLASKASSTTTSSTNRSRKRTKADSSSSHENTTSSQGTSAGVSPSALQSDHRPSSLSTTPKTD